jgi:hypothetical protein
MKKIDIAKSDKIDQIREMNTRSFVEAFYEEDDCENCPAGKLCLEKYGSYNPRECGETCSSTINMWMEEEVK